MTHQSREDNYSIWEEGWPSTRRLYKSGFKTLAEAQSYAEFLNMGSDCYYYSVSESALNAIVLGAKGKES
jgi:hypothetical protein